MNNLYNYLLFFIFSGFIFTSLILTYQNFDVVIGPISSDTPVINIDPEAASRFPIYKLFSDKPPYVEVIEWLDTINLRIHMEVVNHGLIPSAIERINYRIRVNGRVTLSGTATIGEELLPNDYYNFNITLRIPIPKDAQFINQLLYSNGFINIYIEGVSYLRVGGVPVLKPIEYSIDISLLKILKSFFLGEKVRFPGGKLTVLDVKWYSGGDEVNMVKPNQKVTVTVVLTSEGDDFEGTIEIYIYKDLVFLPDEIYAGRRYSIYIGEDEILMLVLTFKTPPEYEFNLVGFYVVIEQPTKGVQWVMPSKYPPRLKAST